MVSAYIRDYLDLIQRGDGDPGKYVDPTKPKKEKKEKPKARNIVVQRGCFQMAWRGVMFSLLQLPDPIMFVHHPQYFSKPAASPREITLSFLSMARRLT